MDSGIAGRLTNVVLNLAINANAVAFGGGTPNNPSTMSEAPSLSPKPAKVGEGTNSSIVIVGWKNIKKSNSGNGRFRTIPTLLAINIQEIAFMVQV